MKLLGLCKIMAPVTLLLCADYVECLNNNKNYQLTVKFVVLLPAPPGVVTEIFPVIAPVGTVAVTLLSEFTVNVVAAIPPNFTAVACNSPVPLIVTTVPTGPLAGVKLVIPGSTLNFSGVSRLPVGSSTSMLAVVAFGGTVAVRYVPLVAVKVAEDVPNKTPVADVKPWPSISTTVPSFADLRMTVSVKGSRLLVKL